jgi:hypothetical protein
VCVFVLSRRASCNVIRCMPVPVHENTPPVSSAHVLHVIDDDPKTKKYALRTIPLLML